MLNGSEVTMHFVIQNLQGKTVWAYCTKCHTMQKNPPMWITNPVQFECLTCTQWIAETIVVGEGAAPPKWWVDKMYERK